MTCHAIKLNPDERWEECMNCPMDNCIFCEEHQDILPNDHKDRWISKFLLAADGEPFMYKFDETKMERILRDLEDETIVLTKEDISRLTSRRKYIDIYILLFEQGSIDLYKNSHQGLYIKSIEYLSEFWFLGQDAPVFPFSPLAKQIRDTLLLKDVVQLRYFFYNMNALMNYRGFQGDLLHTRIAYITIFLSELLESEAAAKLSWEPFREPLLKHYETTLGKDHLLTSYFRSVYLSEFYDVYNAEKKYQKDRIDAIKEELMAVCWHPDRFLTWCLDEAEKRENTAVFG